ADANFDDREDQRSPAERTDDAVRLGGRPAGERERPGGPKIELACGAQVHEVALAQPQSRSLYTLEPFSPLDLAERAIPRRIVRNLPLGLVKRPVGHQAREALRAERLGSRVVAWQRARDRARLGRGGIAAVLAMSRKDQQQDQDGQPAEPQPS